MSRIGKEPIEVPDGVDVEVSPELIKVKGKQGSLERPIHHAVDVSYDREKKIIVVKPKVENNESKKFHGLTRSLVSNMVEGVNVGYKKSLSLIGVGYRAAKEGDGLNLTLGYSHNIIFPAFPGVKLEVEKLTTIHVSGPSKEDVGEIAARIRRLRPPEPYHGKGVRYSNEVIVTKAGKAAKK